MRYSLIVLVLSFIFISINSCSDEPTSIGSNLINNDFIYIGSFDSRVDSLAQSSSFFQKVISLGFSTKIHIGKRGDMEASTLLKFVFSVEDSLKNDFLEDSIAVTKAFIELTPVDTFTNGAEQLDFSVHKINNDWSITGFTSDDLQTLSYDATDLSSNKNFADSLYTCDIDNNLILSWIKTSIDTSLEKNYGIYFKPNLNSGKIISFQALTPSSTNAAKLKVIIEKQGNFVDTISGFIFGDISVVTTVPPVLPTGEIGIQASTSFRSKIFFDLSTLPENIIINKAELYIQQDTLNSIVGTGGGVALAGYLITSADSNEFDETSKTVINRTDNIYSAEISHLIDYWYNGGDNFGMLLTQYNEYEGFNFYALKGSDFPVETERPRLKIIYTTKEN